MDERAQQRETFARGGDKAYGGDGKAAGMGELGGQLRDQARQAAEHQKQSTAEALGATGRSIRDAADDIEQQLPPAAALIREGATRLEQAAASLRERSVDDLVSSANGFARAQPLAFFGAAVLAGLALSRFLKSSGPSETQKQG